MVQLLHVDRSVMGAVVRQRGPKTASVRGLAERLQGLDELRSRRKALVGIDVAAATNERRQARIETP